MTKLKALLAKKDSNKGFTLMEMIIVIAIIAILIALIAPNLISYLDTANETKRAANAKVCYTSANAWVAQMKVEGKSVGKGKITYTAPSPSGVKDSTITIDDAGFKKLNDSIKADTWATGETCVLEFNAKGVCEKATYTSDGDSATYPAK